MKEMNNYQREIRTFDNNEILRTDRDSYCKFKNYL